MTILETLTQQKDGEHREVWAQREYVAALEAGHGFAAHGEAWLYLHRESMRGVILFPFSNGEGCQRIEVPIKTGDWIRELRAHY